MNMDHVATQAAREVAKKYGLEADALFAPWATGGFGSLVTLAARIELVGILDKARRGVKPRYTVEQLMEWFGASRATIARYRRKASGYVPRRKAVA